jgi:hypothetical protein
MNLDEITAAVDAGKTVHWMNELYTVIRNPANNQYYIHCPSTGSSTPLLGELAGLAKANFFMVKPAERTRRSWLLGVRATCLVDADSEEGAREAWEDGLEYEYTIDTEGGILNIEPYLDHEPRPEGAPGEMVLSVTGDELKVLRDLLYNQVDFPAPVEVDQSAFDSVLEKVAGTTNPLPEEPPFQGFSASMLGL